MRHACIRLAADADRQAWDAYVNRHPHATAYHLFGWREVVRKTYGHEACYLMLLSEPSSQNDPESGQNGPAGSVRGVLPVFRIKSRLFGHSLCRCRFWTAAACLPIPRRVRRRWSLNSYDLGGSPVPRKSSCATRGRLRQASARR